MPLDVTSLSVAERSNLSARTFDACRECERDHDLPALAESRCSAETRGIMRCESARDSDDLHANEREAPL